MKPSGQGVSRQPLVSIITIVFNGAAVIRETMESVLHQTYRDLEYIVIDGGSSDGTTDILREYDRRSVDWISEPDNGISDAFNKGIKRARGEIIGLLNAGDRYEPDTVRQVVDAFRANAGVGVVCGAVQFWRGKQKEYRCESVPELLEREMTVAHPTCFVRADLYRQVGGFSPDYKLAMDYELLLRIKQRGARFVALDHVLANMQHDGVSEENWKAALRETHRARTEVLDKSIFTSPWYYHFLSWKRGIRITLERLGWDAPLRLYRSRIAWVKKKKS